MAGRTVLFTGATRGVGKATALQLARLGADVVITGHNRARGEATVAALRAAGSPTAEFIQADLTSQDEVRRLAAEFRRRRGSLHVLFNCAVAMPPAAVLTPEGIDAGFAANYVAPYLLTTELLDVLKASAPSRVLMVSSMGHGMIKQVDFDAIEGRKRWDQMASYGTAKTAQVLFAYELARRLEGTSVTANVVDPAVVTVSSVAEQYQGPALKRFFFFWLIPHLLGVSPEKASETFVWAAAAPELERSSGRYLIKMKEQRSSRLTYDEVLAKRLWSLSESWVARSAPVGAALTQPA